MALKDVSHNYHPFNQYLGGNHFFPKVWSGLARSRVDISMGEATSELLGDPPNGESQGKVRLIQTSSKLGISEPTTLIIFDSHASL